jgi:signal transduction histidine kinase
MSVRTRLIAVTVTELVVTLVIILIILVSTSNADRSDDQVRLSLKRLTQAQAVAKNAGLEMDRADDLIISDGVDYEPGDYNQRVLNSFVEWEKSLESAIVLAGSSDLGHGQQSELLRVQSLRKSYKALGDMVQQAIALSGKGDAAQAVAVSAKATSMYQTAFLPGLESAITVEQVNATRADEQSKKASNNARLTPLIIAPMGLAVLAVLSLLLMRDLTGSLRALEEGVRRIEAGELGTVIDAGRDDEFKAVADAFNAMSAELKRTTEELRAYAHTVSHDLKGPLSSAIMASKLLAEEAASPWKQDSGGISLPELAAMVNENIERAVDLTAELLQLAEAGQSPSEIENVYVTAVVDTVLEEKASRIEGGGIEVRVDRDLGVLKGNSSQVYQVFTNLVDNAIKYGAPVAPRHQTSPAAEKPVISVENLGTDAAGAHSYRVRDNGPGIPADLLEGLFHPFIKGSEGGTGIGLATVQKIVGVYGGEISVRNDGGAVFEFTLHDQENAT